MGIGKWMIIGLVAYSVQAAAIALSLAKTEKDRNHRLTLVWDDALPLGLLGALAVTVTEIVVAIKVWQ